MNNHSVVFHVLIRVLPRFSWFTFGAVSLLIVLYGCDVMQHIQQTCEEDEIRDGYQCISEEQMAQPCSHLPEDQQQFCKDVVAKRIVFFKQHEGRFSDKDKQSMREQIIRDIKKTDRAIQHYHAGVKYICAVSNKDVKCTELSSIAAFYDNEVTDSLLDDLRAIGVGEVKDGEVLLNCGNGVLSVASLADIPGAIMPADPPETPGSTDVPPDMEPPEDTDGWESFFSEAAGDSLNVMCEQLRNQAASGSAVAAALGLGLIGPEQCDVFAIDDPAFLERSRKIIGDTLDYAGQFCNSIMPFDSTVERRYEDSSGNEVEEPVDPPQFSIEDVKDFLEHLARSITSGHSDSDSDPPDTHECWAAPASGEMICGVVVHIGEEEILLPDDDEDPRALIKKKQGETWIIEERTFNYDCVDPADCETCRKMLKSYLSDMRACLREESDSPLCENIKSAADCCASDSDSYVDPRIIIPNPEGEYACYAQLNPGEVQRQYCQDICSVASGHTDCVDNCMVKAHPLLEFDLMDNACQYMISETCFERALPEGSGIPARPGGSGPPRPFTFIDKTLVPEIITLSEPPD